MPSVRAADNRRRSCYSYVRWPLLEVRVLPTADLTCSRSGRTRTRLGGFFPSRFRHYDNASHYMILDLCGTKRPFQRHTLVQSALWRPNDGPEEAWLAVFLDLFSYLSGCRTTLRGSYGHPDRPCDRYHWWRRCR